MAIVANSPAIANYPALMGLDDLEQVHVTTRGQWRDWLAAHGDSSPGIWLVVPRNLGRGSALSYDDIVEEALCFGWIDSTVRSRDDQTRMMLMTRRKPRSTWAASNKARVERLTATGRMDPRGLDAVEQAKANGSWTMLDAVERMEVPEDLAAALDAVPAARRSFDGFPPSARKQLLWHVLNAKRPETRARRIATIVSEAAEGRRPVG